MNVNYYTTQQLYFWAFVPEKWGLVFTKTCTQMFTAALFIIDKNEK